MGRTSKQMTYTDGSYFCNLCDTPHESEELADNCYEGCIDAIRLDVAYPWRIYSAAVNLYWSNEDGWVDLKSATRFSSDERVAFTLLPGRDSRWIHVASLEN